MKINSVLLVFNLSVLLFIHLKNSVDCVLRVVSCDMHEAHFKQQVQLVVICIRAIESVLLAQELSKQTGVHDEKKRPKYGALWYSTDEQCCL